LRVRSGAGQLGRLPGWAARWPERVWAVEGAAGLGYLLARQLVAAGEQVCVVQPKLAARVRLLATGATNKNDPNDACSVAIAALRWPAVSRVRAENHAAVMKVWAKHHRDLGSVRTQVACRLHAVLCALVPGGFAGEISAARAARLLDELQPDGAVAAARYDLARQFTADLRRIDEQMRDTRSRLAAPVAASQTTTTQIFGVGPVVAAIVIGEAGHITRFASRDHFAAYNGTAPVEVSSGHARSTGCPGAATAGSTTPSTWPPSPRSGTATPTAGPISSGSSPKARPGKKRCDRSSAESAMPCSPACRPTPAKPREPSARAREGNRGTTVSPARPAHTPSAGSSAKPLPDPTPPYGPARSPDREDKIMRDEKDRQNLLTTKRLRSGAGVAGRMAGHPTGSQRLVPGNQLLRSRRVPGRIRQTLVRMPAGLRLTFRVRGW
jgi:transposase